VIVFDTDVLLDVVLDREPHADASSDLLELLERRGRLGFVSWHTVSNYYYMVRAGQGPVRAKESIDDLLSFVRVTPTDTASLKLAVSLPMSDLEDAMVVAAAQSCGALYIATRNVRDFKKSPVPAKTPAQLLAEWA
jgi:predicted nucleic acid-binding protein